VRTLIDAKAPLDNANRMGWTALLIAVLLGNNSKGHIETVELLVKAGADTAIKDRQGATALDHARTRGYQDMIKILEAAQSRKT
jgi:ankyrin repeat protein